MALFRLSSSLTAATCKTSSGDRKASAKALAAVSKDEAHSCQVPDRARDLRSGPCRFLVCRAS